MSVLLEYEFKTGSLAALKGAFRTVEGMAAQSARNEERIRDRAARPARVATVRATIDPQKKALEDLQKFGQTRMRQELAERQRLDRRAHADRMRMIDAERREGIAAERARDRVRRATIGNAAGSAIRGSVGIGKAILGATGLAGGAIIASRIGPGIDLEHRQRDVLRNARMAGDALPMSPAELRGRVSATAIATGASEGAITGGIGAFVEKTGDLKTATDNMETFSKVAMAAGANVEDVFSAAADISKKFGITKIDEMKQAFADLTFQGKKGAFVLRDMASTMPELASAFSAMGGKGIGGVKELGGLAQIAKTGTGNADEAKTALVDVFAEIVAKSAKLQSGAALGGRRVQVFEHGDPTKNMLGPSTVLANVIAASRGNMVELEEIFGRRGIKAVNPLIATYKQAAGAAGGSAQNKADAGRKALLDMIATASETGAQWSDVQVDAADAMKDTTAQIEILNSKLQEAVSEKLLPALIALLPKLEPLIPKFGDLLEELTKWVGWLAENPASGIGIAITLAILKDIAAAGLGPAIAEAIVAAIAAGRAASAAGAVASGMAGLAGTTVAGGGALMAARAALAGGAGASPIAATLGAAALAGGGVYAAVDQNDRLKNAAGGLGIFDLLGGALSGKGGFMKQIENKQNADAQAEAAKALKDAAAALKTAAAGMAPGAPPTPGGPLNRGADPTPPRL